MGVGLVLPQGPSRLTSVLLFPQAFPRQTRTAREIWAGDIAHQNPGAQSHRFYILGGCHSAGLVTNEDWGLAMQVDPVMHCTVHDRCRKV